MWGITARNREQNFALNALMDPEIDFVTLLGTAGTGKTLLALAAGLAQTMDQQRYREIIMTRATVSVGEDIGFLPGTEEEKMTPWMGALTDNLEVLTHNQEGGSWGRAATNDLLASRIKIRSLNFMRGRTFLSRWLILDEAQNLTPKQMKTLITRAGPGTKIVCLGNVEQIDTPYLTETTSGLTYAVDRFKGWDAQRAHHPASRRAFAPGGLRVGSAVSWKRAPPGLRSGRSRKWTSMPPRCGECHEGTVIRDCRLGLDRCRRWRRRRHGQRGRLSRLRTPGGHPPHRHHQPARRGGRARRHRARPCTAG